jgi:hypothetical protein
MQPPWGCGGRGTGIHGLRGRTRRRIHWERHNLGVERRPEWSVDGRRRGRASFEGCPDAAGQWHRHPERPERPEPAASVGNRNRNRDGDDHRGVGGAGCARRKARVVESANVERTNRPDVHSERGLHALLPGFTNEQASRSWHLERESWVAIRCWTNKQLCELRGRN